MINGVCNVLSFCVQDQAKNDRNFLPEVIVTFPFPKDEHPVTGTKILGYCEDSS